MHNAKSEKPPRVVLPPYTGFVLFGIAAGVSHAVSWRATGPGASESGVLHPERVGGASRGGSRCSPYNRALAGGWLLNTKASGRERSRHSCSSCWPCLHRPPQQPAHRVSVERIGAGRENKGGSRATRIFWLPIKLVRPPVPRITLSAFFGSLLLFVAVDARRR